MDDAKIIALYFARNEDAIAETDAAYGRKLHTLAQNIVSCYEDAQESVSDTYYKAWETIPPTHPVHFYAYLSRICRNFAFGRLDWKNAAKRRAEVVSLSAEMEQCIPDRSRDRELTGKELGRLLNGFLAQLSTETRVIFLRRYWQVETVGEIAQALGISESKVKTQLHRTRKKLEIYLNREGIQV
ncbi:MAG: sigma-70 family RNA polymerase sigma factor [Oscillospiraceae bacterium]|nr:sigma-70 family RNA polymerase sigma factor [Oscillospiraceae bacterium]